MSNIRSFLGVPIAILRMFLLVAHTVVRKEVIEDLDSSQNLQTYYDFVVVGSGSSGSVVASRLSEEGWRILLLEAGGEMPIESYVPGLYPIGLVGDTDWHYKTEPQKYSSSAFTDSRIIYYRGKVAGGSSTTNTMLYVRGNYKDYDNWANMGNTGWDFNSVLKYMKKSEDYHGHHAAHPDADIYYGRGGPLHVEKLQWSSPLAKGFLQAGQELGYPVDNQNITQQIGFSIMDTTTRMGLRESVAESFLRPAAKRENLHIALNAYATKILFDEKKRAIGVTFNHNGKSKIALVKREVILSAGAINSPHLLMLSGVGPEKHLKQHGITVVQNLPGVGQNLQDHPTIQTLAWTVNPGNSPNIRTLISPHSISQESNYNTGPLSAPLGLEVIAWMVGEEDPEWPELQFHLVSATAATDNGLLTYKLLGLKKEVFEDYFKDIRGQEGFTIMPMLTRPKSRGSIKLKSSNPLDKPLIDPNFLSNLDDVRLLVKGLKFASSIGSTSALRNRFGAKINSKALPGCEHFELESDEYWACYTRRTVSSNLHAAGSCKMGPQWDPYSVVDNRLKVRGVSGLRVIDASIMPLVTTGNTNAPCIMIGERGADFIKEDYELPLK